MTMTRHKNIFILNNFSSRTETITQNEVYRIFRSFTLFFKFTWPCIVTNFFVIKPTRCTSFTKLFCYETLHISDSSSVHYQEFYSLYTQQLYMSYRFVDSFRAGPSLSCSKAVYKPVWHISLLNMQWINSWWWTDELSKTCIVSWQNKFVKFVQIFGFITKKVSTCVRQ